MTQSGHRTIGRLETIKDASRRISEQEFFATTARRLLLCPAVGLVSIRAHHLIILGGHMNKSCVLGLCAIAFVTIPALPNSGLAQGKSLKDQLVGTWIYVSSTGKRDDGSTVPRPSLQGAVTYTADGRFHFITTRTDTPKVASSDPSRPTPEEAMAIASGSVAYTGTYTVDEGTKTVHANIETSTFANLVGAPNQRRIISSITSDDMKFTNPRTPAGVTLEFVWKRAK
jgi:Lipocalin-like domain